MSRTETRGETASSRDVRVCNYDTDVAHSVRLVAEGERGFAATYRLGPDDVRTATAALAGEECELTVGVDGRPRARHSVGVGGRTVLVEIGNGVVSVTEE